MVESTITAAAIRSLDPLLGHYASGPGVSLVPVPARPKVSLHGHPDATAAISDALGIALPTRPKTVAETETLAALWLGPEDWLLVGASENPADAAALIAAVEAAPTADKSAVDVSDRFVAVAVEGPAAEAVLSACCPQDLRLRSFPVGAASRSLFQKIDVIIWRRSETGFEIYCGRSFSDYLWALLVEAARAPAV